MIHDEATSSRAAAARLARVAEGVATSGRRVMPRPAPRPWPTGAAGGNRARRGAAV